jgi:hypothetical protein
VLSYVSAIIAAVAAPAVVCWLVRTGFRNGDRPGDARVRAALHGSGQPDEERPVAVVTVRNRGGAPVLAAVGVRRALFPGWLTGTVSVVVPRRTTRRAFRPDGYPTVGVVDGGAAEELIAPVPPAARHYLLTVLVGQREGRLRAYRLRLAAAPARGRRAAQPRYRQIA